MDLSPKAFFADRWQGRTAVRVLFWRDLLGWATLLNLLVGFASLVMLAKRVEAPWPWIAHLLPMPYNLFLGLSVWRHRDALKGHKLVVVAWLAVMWII